MWKGITHKIHNWKYEIDCSGQEDFSERFEVIFEKQAGESAWGARKRKSAEKVLSPECVGGSAWACVARQVSVCQGNIAQNWLRGKMEDQNYFTVTSTSTKKSYFIFSRRNYLTLMMPGLLSLKIWLPWFRMVNYVQKLRRFA